MQVAMQRAVAAPAPAEDFEEQTAEREQSAIGTHQRLIVYN